jgi:sideroflexin-1/3
VALTGLCLSVSTPLGCALFPQQASITLEQTEPEPQAKAMSLKPVPRVLYYNKGL